MIQKAITTFTSLLLALCAGFATRPAVAQQSGPVNFVVEVKSAEGAPVSGVQIFGNYGVNALPGRFTSSDGRWNFDVSDLPSANPELAFTHPGLGLRFNPPSIIVSETNCPGHICRIRAVSDGHPAALIHWTIANRNGVGIPGVPVVVPNAPQSCPKNTDHEGYVLFPVERSAGACSDSDSSQTNNYYSVLPLSPAGYNCTFSTPRSDRFRACTKQGDVVGVVTANCGFVAPKAVGSSTSYTLQVVTDNYQGAVPVTFYGNEGLNSLSNRYTDSTGKWTFTTAQLATAASTAITVVPSGNFTFYPPSLTLTPNSCPNNLCQIWAVKNGSAQAAVTWKTQLSPSSALAGVALDSPALARCGNDSTRITDNSGYAVFPAPVVSSCSDADEDPSNNYISLNPSSPGCSFSHSSGTPFQFCANSTTISGSYNANCSGDSTRQFTLSGTVLNAEGFPIAGANVLNSGMLAATTRADGTYSIVADEQSTARLSVDGGALAFDPVEQSIVSIDRNRKALDFRVVAPVAEDPSDDPEAPCDVAPVYRLAGQTLDEQGNPLGGVEILDNHTHLTVSGSDGLWEALVPAGSNNWITAEYQNRYFDPAGISVPRVLCPRSDIDFKLTETPSFTFAGQVTDWRGYGMSDAKVVVRFRGIEEVIDTNSDGSYMLTLPEDADYQIIALREGSEFSPGQYAGSAEENNLLLDFAEVPPPTATPTPSPTSTYTPTPTRTPATPPTATPAPTAPPPTAAPTATATRVPTATNTSVPATPTATSVPSATFTPTRVPATSTATSTPVPNTPTATPSKTPTQPPATATRAATNTPTIAPTQTPLPATPTNTATPIPPTATSVPSNTPTDDSANKITICHIPPGNPENAQTLSISASAWSAHQAHGDYQGSCGSRTTPTATPVPQTPTPTGAPSRTPTFTPTARPTETATPTPTSTWTPTASPTATVIPVSVALESLCSVNPDAQLAWRVTNQGPQSLMLRWQIYGTSQQGMLDLGAFASRDFSSLTVSANPNAMQIFLDSRQLASRLASFTRCSATPTPAPTSAPTLAPTAVPTSTPTTPPTATREPEATARPQPTEPPATPTPISTQPGEPTPPPAPTSTFTPTPQPTETATPPPTSTATPSPTAIPSFVISGSLKDTLNGRALSESLMRKLARLSEGSLRVVAKSRDGTIYRSTVKSPFDYALEVPAGKYSVKFESLSTKLNVISRPSRYELRVDEDRAGVHFAVRLGDARLSGQSKVSSRSKLTRLSKGVK